MPGNGAVLDFCGSFSDGVGLGDLTARVFEDARVLRAAYAALRPQVGNQLFFQHSAGLNEQATVNGLVRHAHTLVAGILGRQPSGNLFRRPVQQQFTRNDLSQLLPHAEPLPDSPSMRRGSEAARSYEAMHRKPTLARCPLAQSL